MIYCRHLEEITKEDITRRHDPSSPSSRIKMFKGGCIECGKVHQRVRIATLYLEEALGGKSQGRV